MTLATLAGYLLDRPSRTTVAIDIEGLPYLFTERAIASSALDSPLSGKMQLQCIEAESVQIGEFDLDIESRRISSATASFRLLDDAGGVLRSLITPAARRIAWVTSSVASGDTFIPVNISSRTVSSTPIYVAGETMVCTNWSGGIMTVTRGAFGSDATAHFGNGTGAGTEVFLSPRAWVNRRCRIYLFALDDNGSAIKKEQSAVIYDGVLSSAPRTGQGGWDFEVEHASEKINNALCTWGQREIVVDREIQDRAELTRFYVNELDFSLLSTTDGVSSRLMIQSKDGTVLSAITAIGADYVDTRPSFAEVILDPQGGTDNIRLFRWEYAKKIRHVLRLKGNAATVAARLLGTSTAPLPSVGRTEYGGQQWRFSAGLDDYVDDDTFAELAQYCQQWDTVLTESITAGEVLRELMVSSRSVWYSDEDTGKIAFLPLSSRNFDATPSTTFTVDNVIGEPETDIEQGPALHSVTLEAGYDPITGEYLATVESADAEIAAEFGDDAAKQKISSKFLAVDVGDFLPRERRYGTLNRSLGMSYVDVVALLRRTQLDSLAARVKHTITVPLKYLYVKIGDVVAYTDYRANNGNGSTASGNHYVVGKSIDLVNGTVTLKLLAAKSGWVFAPGALITAYNAGTLTATLDTTISGNSQPGLLFPVGADVYAHNMSTGTTDYLSVASRTTTTVTFVGAMSAYTTNQVILYFDGGATLPSGRDRSQMLNQVPTSGSTIGDEYNTEWG